MSLTADSDIRVFGASLLSSTLQASEPETFSFILLPQFSMIALSAALEPLRHANRLSGKALYSWKIYSSNGLPVTSSSGVRFQTDGDLEAVEPRSTLVICGGGNIDSISSTRLVNWLRRAARFSPLIGGLCTAPHILAAAGLLNGYRATIHWESLAPFRETFPDVEVTDQLFEVYHNRFTCAGETASIDLMLCLLATRHGDHFATMIADQVLHAKIRGPNVPQRRSCALRTGVKDPRLLQAISLMEQNIEDPLGLLDVADQIGCSRRQLERLFRRHLAISPVRYYRNLRLERAKSLLLETDLSETEIGIACGFSCTNAFSRHYRKRYGVSPSGERTVPQIGQVLMLT